MADDQAGAAETEQDRDNAASLAPDATDTTTDTGAAAAEAGDIYDGDGEASFPKTSAGTNVQSRKTQRRQT